MPEASTSGSEHAYRDLSESEELHRATLASISDAILITDDHGAFTFICPNVDVIFGYTTDEVQGLGVIARLLGPPFFNRAELAKRGEIRNIECEVTIKSGARRTLLVHVKAVSIKGGTVLYCCRDVTELRHAEEELRVLRMELAHVSRLGLVGQLLASITHEIKQPLTAIINNASVGRGLLTNDLPSPLVTDLRDIFDDIVAEGRLAADVVDRLRTLSRKRPLSMLPVDLNELAAETIRFVEHDARSHQVAVVADLDPALPDVRADRVCLQQVLLTLAVNAIEAMGETVPADRQLALTTRRSTDGVELTVSDRGHGIPSEDLPNLFEPFFTTKSQGLGLGLAIARSIIDTHGGRIWADEVAGGATFHVSLPAAR
jgi:PAS domain S-box-containing protein